MCMCAFVVGQDRKWRFGAIWSCCTHWQCLPLCLWRAVISYAAGIYQLSRGAKATGLMHILLAATCIYCLLLLEYTVCCYLHTLTQRLFSISCKWAALPTSALVGGGATPVFPSSRASSFILAAVHNGERLSHCSINVWYVWIKCLKWMFGMCKMFKMFDHADW